MANDAYQENQKEARLVASVFEQWAKNIVRHNRRMQIENDKFYQEVKQIIEVVK